MLLAQSLIKQINLVEKRNILQALNVLAREEDGNAKCLRQIAHVWPPEGLVFSSFLKQSQAQPHRPQFLCHILTMGLILIY